MVGKIKKNIIEKRSKENKFEKRSQTPVDTELRVVRSEGQPTVIEGFSIVYDVWTNIGWFDEKISRGAASKVYNAKGIAGLVDHRSEMIIGRTGINIEAIESDQGVFIKVTEPKAGSQRFEQLASDVESGLVTGQSFAFRSNHEKETWINEVINDGSNGEPIDIREKREIGEISEIVDYSFVTYPAYADTTAAKRSLDKFKTSETRGNNNTETSIDTEYEDFILTNIKNERGFK